MRIMSVDYGDVRTGLAICDESEKLASPVTVIRESYQPKLIEKIKAVISEQKPQELVVGFPRNMDGTEGERARKCSDFAKKLGESAALPVHLWDERMTTVSAHNNPAGLYKFQKKQ